MNPVIAIFSTMLELIIKLVLTVTTSSVLVMLTVEVLVVTNV